MINSRDPDFSNTPAAANRAAFPYRSAETDAAPIVSVITPYYNTDEVFLETVKSVLAQSCQNLEWIIVDDGSTNEAALDRLHAVQASDARIKVVLQKNAGPAAARNTAVKHSIGRYLCLLDSDDMLEPTFIEKCLWFLESNPQFAFCNSWSVHFEDKSFLWKVGFETGKLHLDTNSGPPMSVVRREAFDASGGFDESIRFGHEDWDFWLALAKAGYWGHTLPEYLSWYRRRSAGRFQQVMSSGSVNREFEELMAKRYADLRVNFPAPEVCYPAPYETVPSLLPFANKLAKPEHVRRILFLIPWMVTGGADKVNLDWIRALIQNGYQVSICATLESENNWLHEFAALTPDIFVLPTFLRTADYPRFLRSLIESRQIDTVLISASTFGYLTLPYLRSHFPALTFVDLCHVEEAWMNGGHPRFAVGYQEMLDLNLVTTAHLRDWMVEKGAQKERIEVCYTGIDCTQLEAGDDARKRARERLQLHADIPVIVFAGRFCEQKRPQFLAAILQTLAARGSKFQALIIGDGDLQPAFADTINKANLASSVRLLGRVDHVAWLEVLAASDIFLLPSLYEGISVALLEAMGMGVVPVTASVGGQEEVVTPECGFLIPHSERELGDYVETLARLIAQPDFRATVGQAARAHIFAQFNLPATTSTLLQHLQRARQFAAEEARVALPRGFAQEVATLAVEYTRLNNVANTLWINQASAGAPTGEQGISAESLKKLYVLLRRTRLGTALLQSTWLRKCGRWLIARLEK
ncbi:MAG: glycosyltransferase [Burkholderiaceae bacterium]|nr:glycosyltransferase [Burkholderiaceae bacterium]